MSSSFVDAPAVVMIDDPDASCVSAPDTDCCTDEDALDHVDDEAWSGGVVEGFKERELHHVVKVGGEKNLCAMSRAMII